MTNWEEILYNAWQEASENKLIEEGELTMKTYKDFLNANIQLEFEDKAIIENQIKRLTEMFNLNIIQQIIICDLLIENVNYALVCKDLDTYIISLSKFEKDIIIYSLDNLVSLDLLELTKEDNKNYYSLNNRKLNDLNI